MQDFFYEITDFTERNQSPFFNPEARFGSNGFIPPVPNFKPENKVDIGSIMEAEMGEEVLRGKRMDSLGDLARHRFHTLTELGKVLRRSTINDPKESGSLMDLSEIAIVDQTRLAIAQKLTSLQSPVDSNDTLKISMTKTRSRLERLLFRLTVAETYFAKLGYEQRWHDSLGKDIFSIPPHVEYLLTTTIDGHTRTIGTIGLMPNNQLPIYHYYDSSLRRHIENKYDSKASEAVRLSTPYPLREGSIENRELKREMPMMAVLGALIICHLRGDQVMVTCQESRMAKGVMGKFPVEVLDLELNIPPKNRPNIPYWQTGRPVPILYPAQDKTMLTAALDTLDNLKYGSHLKIDISDLGPSPIPTYPSLTPRIMKYVI
ncbi:hypothetical protein IPJ72_02035 [Candidatus Peregrinibacteria bacterium]|nr:MAG: hypothetical protein IPJ72_02035 [Candidatus Peregrinibacteria bacterium]